MRLSTNSIDINPKEESDKIISFIKKSTFNTLKKKGLVVGLSGGVDSAVVTALCINAIGKEKVIAVMMPEKDSNPESLVLAQQLSEILGIKYIVEDITEAVDGFGCYKRRDDAVKSLFPEYTRDYRMKISLPKDEKNTKKLNVFYLSIISPDGIEKKIRLPFKEYLQIVAASNIKQRSRMNMLYYHAESRNYAVAGTGNRNEHEQGFFVKYGDGGADLKPIAHLFKTQIYQLAEYLQIPEEIRNRIPTTDTYSAEQTQEEFFFKIPFDILDKVWYGLNNKIGSEEISRTLDLDIGFVENVINDIQHKIKSTEYLRMEPLSLVNDGV